VRGRDRHDGGNFKPNMEKQRTLAKLISTSEFGTTSLYIPSSRTVHGHYVVLRKGLVLLKLPAVKSDGVICLDLPLNMFKSHSDIWLNTDYELGDRALIFLFALRYSCSNPAAAVHACADLRLCTSALNNLHSRRGCPQLTYRTGFSEARLASQAVDFIPPWYAGTGYLPIPTRGIFVPGAQRGTLMNLQNGEQEIIPLQFGDEFLVNPKPSIVDELMGDYRKMRRLMLSSINVQQLSLNTMVESMKVFSSEQFGLPTWDGTLCNVCISPLTSCKCGKWKDGVYYRGEYEVGSRRIVTANHDTNEPPPAHMAPCVILSSAPVCPGSKKIKTLWAAWKKTPMGRRLLSRGPMSAARALNASLNFSSIVFLYENALRGGEMAADEALDFCRFMCAAFEPVPVLIGAMQGELCSVLTYGQGAVIHRTSFRETIQQLPWSQVKHLTGHEGIYYLPANHPTDLLRTHMFVLHSSHFTLSHSSGDSKLFVSPTHVRKYLLFETVDRMNSLRGSFLFPPGIRMSTDDGVYYALHQQNLPVKMVNGQLRDLSLEDREALDQYEVDHLLD